MKGKEWRRKESEKVNISREGKYLKMRGNKGREGAHVRLVESIFIFWVGNKDSFFIDDI